MARPQCTLTLDISVGSCGESAFIITKGTEVLYTHDGSFSEGATTPLTITFYHDGTESIVISNLTETGYNHGVTSYSDIVGCTVSNVQYNSKYSHSIDELTLSDFSETASMYIHFECLSF